MSSAIIALLPRWTKKVTIEDSGRDPLGLSHVSSIIIDFLLQGIITQTHRARYYSFYCWTIWHIQEQQEAGNYEQFAAAFQRRDTLFSLASLESNPQSSPVGVRVAEARLQNARKAKEAPCNFRVLPSNALGAFGQYYAGSIYELGLISRREDGVYQVTPSGEALAKAFHSSIEDTPYVKKKLSLDNSLQWSDFKKTAAKFNLDYLSYSPVERDLLITLFFSLEKKVDRALMRKHSLLLLLFIIDAYEQQGSKLKSGNRWGLVYTPTYYGCLQLASGKTRPLSLPHKLSGCATFWQQFCLHQFITQALEQLLTAVLETLTGGLTLDDICVALTSKTLLAELQEIHGAHCGRPADLLEHLGGGDRPFVQRSGGGRLFSLKHRSSESQLLDREPSVPEDRVAIAVSLLAVVYVQWNQGDNSVVRYIRAHASNELWLGTVLSAVDIWRDQSTTWSSALRNLLSAFILEQHDKVMYQKGKLTSCWLHRADGRVFKDQDYSPMFRSARDENCISILSDLGLLAIDSQKTISIMSRGKTLLKKLMN
jgi:hypothetical protein